MNRRLFNMAMELRNQFLHKSDQFILTGSLALNCYGLVGDEDVKDLDIILVNPTADLRESLSLLEKISPAKNRNANYIGLRDDLFRFSVNDVNVDVFIKTEKREIVYYQSMPLNLIDYIISAKKEMGRLKDYIQLMELANKFITTSEFIDKLKSK